MIKIFFQSVGCHFILSPMSFALLKLLSLRSSHLLIVNHSVCGTGVAFRKHSPVSVISWVTPTFSFKWFSVAVFMMLRSLIHWVMCTVIPMCLSAVHYMPSSSCASTICWRCFPPSIVYFSWSFVTNQDFVGVWVKIMIVNSVPPVYLFIFVPISSYFQN